MKKKVSILFTILLVVIIFIAIYLINSNIFIKPKLNPSNNNKVNNFIIEIDSKISNEDKKSVQYFKAKNLFNESSKASSPDDQYKNLKAAANNLQLLYTRTHHEYLYSLLNNDLDTFAKNNYPNQYEDFAFKYPCQDPSCAESKQPVEILEIIEYIKTSDLSQEYKDNFTGNLINTAYETNDKHTQAWSYFSTALSLDNSNDLSTSGSNIIISNKIKDFLKNKYPTEYEQLLKSEEFRKQNNADKNPAIN